MQAIADEAGVAVQTVYFTFHTKAALVMTIEVRAVGGEDQEWWEQRQRELTEERSPRKVVTLWVAGSAKVLNRITAFVALLGANLEMDAESVERRTRERDLHREPGSGDLSAHVARGPHRAIDDFPHRRRGRFGWRGHKSRIL